jgi:hypothetical protein
VSRLLFRVAEVFALKAGRIVVATDCPQRATPAVRVGEQLEFRNPDGSVHRSQIAGILFADPPNPERSFAFPLPSGTPAGAVQVGAEVWSLAEVKHAEPRATAERGGR